MRVQDSLGDLRDDIDTVDTKLVDLLSERARLVQRVGKVKSNTGAPAFSPGRERDILERVARLNAGPLNAAHLQAIFREILSASRTLETPERVAYLGPAFSFTHEAAQRHFGSSAELIPLRSFREIFQHVERHADMYGVVPVENTTSGTIGETLDLFAEFAAHVSSEIVLRISHNLLSVETRPTYSAIYSHPQAFSQCRDWLTLNFPNVPTIETPSTTDAAQRAQRDPTSAAIGTIAAAKAYGLVAVHEQIQDLASNQTRFYVISHNQAPRSGRDKTAVMIEIRDKVGALHDVLGLVRSHGLNLSYIQSRPSRNRSGDYLFFVELNGHPDDPEMAAALSELPKHTIRARVLGAWPANPA